MDTKTMLPGNRSDTTCSPRTAAHTLINRWFDEAAKQVATERDLAGRVAVGLRTSERVRFSHD